VPVDKPSDYEGRRRKKVKRPRGTKIARVVAYVVMSQALRVLFAELFDLVFRGDAIEEPGKEEADEEPREGR
jgi:hypothetical protein